MKNVSKTKYIMKIFVKNVFSGNSKHSKILVKLTFWIKVEANLHTEVAFDINSICMNIIGCYIPGNLSSFHFCH